MMMMTSSFFPLRFSLGRNHKLLWFIKYVCRYGMSMTYLRCHTRKALSLCGVCAPHPNPSYGYALPGTRNLIRNRNSLADPGEREKTTLTVVDMLEIEGLLSNKVYE